MASGTDNRSTKPLCRRNLSFGDNTTGPTMCGYGALTYKCDRLNALLDPLKRDEL